MYSLLFLINRFFKNSNGGHEQHLGEKGHTCAYCEHWPVVNAAPMVEHHERESYRTSRVQKCGYYARVFSKLISVDARQTTTTINKHSYIVAAETN